MAELTLTKLVVRGHAQVDIRDGKLHAKPGEHADRDSRIHSEATGVMLTVDTLPAPEMPDGTTLEDMTRDCQLKICNILTTDSARCVVHDASTLDTRDLLIVHAWDTSVVQFDLSSYGIRIKRMKISLSKKARFITRGKKVVVSKLEATVRDNSSMMGILVSDHAEIEASGSCICRIEASKSCKKRINQHGSLARVLVEPSTLELEEERQKKNRRRAARDEHSRKRVIEEVRQAAIDAGVFEAPASVVRYSRDITGFFEPPRKKQCVEVAAVAPIVVSDDEDGKPKAGPKSGYCAVCYEKPIRTVCLPCAHASMCEDCSTTVLSMRQPCPMCRAKINGVSTIRFAT